MKKLLTLTLSLLMTFSLCLTISAEDEVTVSTASEFKEAVSNASADSTTNIKLNGDFSIDAEFTIDKDIVLDLNGKTLTSEKAIYVNGKTLTVKDSSVNYGKIVFDSYDHSESNGHIYVRNSGNFVLESGTLFDNCDKGGSTIVVGGGAYQSNPAYSKATINGGYITSKESCISISGYGASASVNNGNLMSSTGKDVFKILTNADAKLITVSGGAFSSDVSGFLTDDYNVIKQKVGSLDAFKVVSNDAKVEVTDITAAMNKAAREAINSSTSILDDNNGTVSVDSSTQLVLESKPLEEGYSEKELISVIEQAIDIDTSKLAFIPLDITLRAIKNGTETVITDLGKNEEGLDVEIPVTLYLNEETASTLKDKDIKVVRIHDDTGIAVLDATLNENVLTFNSGKFSTYLICYENAKKEEKKEETSTTSDSASSSTSSAKVVTCEEAMGSKNWTWSESKKACVYKVTNTSAE